MFHAGNIPTKDQRQFGEFWNDIGIFRNSTNLQNKNRKQKKRENLPGATTGPPASPPGRPSPNRHRRRSPSPSPPHQLISDRVVCFLKTAVSLATLSPFPFSLSCTTASTRSSPACAVADLVADVLPATLRPQDGVHLTHRDRKSVV